MNNDEILWDVRALAATTGTDVTGPYRASSRSKPLLVLGRDIIVRPTTARWAGVPEDYERGVQTGVVGGTLVVVRPMSRNKPELMVTLSLRDLLGMID